MTSDRDEETKTLLPNDNLSDASPKADHPKETWATTTVSSRAVYLFCFFILALNAGLLAASWRAQEEIKGLYSSMGRDVTTLPRPDPLVGLSEAAKSHPGGEYCGLYRL